MNSKSTWQSNQLEAHKPARHVQKLNNDVKALSLAKGVSRSKFLVASTVMGKGVLQITRMILTTANNLHRRILDLWRPMRRTYPQNRLCLELSLRLCLLQEYSVILSCVQLIRFCPRPLVQLLNKEQMGSIMLWTLTFTTNGIRL